MWLRRGVRLEERQLQPSSGGGGIVIFIVFETEAAEEDNEYRSKGRVDELLKAMPR